MNRLQTAFVLIFLIFSSSALANRDIQIIKINNILEKNKLNKLIDEEQYKRVISDIVSEENIALFKEKGCLLKHRLENAVSFECPKDVISEFDINVREARIFYIVDLQADRQIRADLVWAEGVVGNGVNIVILDTGIDSSHIELADSLKGQKDFVNNDNIAEDDNGHGTHVAGIITANGINQVNNNYATGVAPGAGIYMLKVCNAGGVCYEDDMMAAMEYAVSLDAEVMSISIGGGNYGSHCDYDPLAAKVNWVVDNGIAVVVASGNDGLGVSSPACASKAIAVGAVDKNNYVRQWSNRGSALDIVAPGVDILSTYSCLAAGDCNFYWYAYMTGTSMATPHVSGVIALLLQKNPSATVDEIKNALYSTAKPAAGCYKCKITWGGVCFSQYLTTCTSSDQGAGIVDAYEAYLAIQPQGECSVDGDCDDNIYCNGIERCQERACQAGTAISCGDGVGCTTDMCNENLDRCDHILNNGYCNDGLHCNGEEYCDVALDCQSGISVICDDGDICTEDYCDESADKCTYNLVQGCCNIDSDCNAANAIEACISNKCTILNCENSYEDCDLIYNDGCEINLQTDSNNCGSCNNVCQEISCPESGCGTNGCTIEEYGTYPLTQQQTCVNSVCSGECTATCGYDVNCDLDDDNDGTLDVGDACPATYGTDCNGCPNPCSGCAVMQCTIGAPKCAAGSCPTTTCPANGCDAGSCAANEYGTYTPANNECIVSGTVGSCTNNPCTLNCQYSSSCETTQTKCWSASNQYLQTSFSQARKFCKCVQGTYGYSRLSYQSKSVIAYRYVDTSNNENWQTASYSTSLPTYKVQCTGGNWYNTNVDYYR